jgi:DNA repair exonuclease SbcCD ATPase subunit
METLNKIKVLLGMDQEVTKEELSEATEQMKFEDIALEDGTIVSADALEVGAAVFIMVEEEKQPLPVGEYALADGSLLVVAEEGIIAEIKAAEEEVKEEEAPAEEMQEADNSKDALVEAIGVLENLVQEFATIKTEFNTLKEKYESVQEEAKELETKVEEFEKVGEEIKPSPEGNFNKVELSPLEFSRLTSQQKVQYNINKSK